MFGFSDRQAAYVVDKRAFHIQQLPFTEKRNWYQYAESNFRLNVYLTEGWLIVSEIGLS